ncbi:ribonuclease domain-containing protein [Dyella tabacisoli]|uniref:Ribonuclease n=1 Tax=Dyella tabacisoli TaxID=2282381 RepID=A0A369USB9_9GAMM|nr:ribonuclease domain-containing protein [Dyella tabacisoli]RDD83367.1 ribonuclease [Dyella tabacisoli]
MRAIRPVLLLIVLIGAGWLWRHHGTEPMPRTAGSSPSSTASLSQPVSAAAADKSLPGFLPPEARDTLALIARGGPFAHRQDGGVFGNREGRLPQQPNGYYHEYTVETPSLDYRGARRIITGGTPPTVYYYTDDHYRSFHSFQVPR